MKFSLIRLDGYKKIASQQTIHVNKLLGYFEYFIEKSTHPEDSVLERIASFVDTEQAWIQSFWLQKRVDVVYRANKYPISSLRSKRLQSSY